MAKELYIYSPQSYFNARNALKQLNKFMA